MKTLNRIFLLVMAATLVAAAFAMRTGMTQVAIGHDTFYKIRWPWLHEVREVALFGVLIWCVLFARSQTTFVRVGLIAVIVAFALMVLPPPILK